MTPRIAVPALFALALLAGGIAEASGAEGLGCLASASADYTREKFRLFQATPFGLTVPVESVLARRRLAETYCLRATRCLFDDDTSFIFQGSFASCLKKESGSG